MARTIRRKRTSLKILQVVRSNLDPTTGLSKRKATFVMAILMERSRTLASMGEFLEVPTMHAENFMASPSPSMKLRGLFFTNAM
jgi:hypothetical protein